MINKTSLKFILGAFLIIGLGVVVWFMNVSASPEAKQEREARAYFENLKEQYENDTYGGDTPEETLALFIEALEKGDVELASKYFVIEEREKWQKNLKVIEDQGQIQEMAEDLNKLRKTKDGEEEVFYTLTNDKNIVSVQLIMGMNQYNGKWQIYEL